MENARNSNVHGDAMLLVKTAKKRRNKYKKCFAAEAAFFEAMRASVADATAHRSVEHATYAESNRVWMIFVPPPSSSLLLPSL